MGVSFSMKEGANVETQVIEVLLWGNKREDREGERK